MHEDGLAAWVVGHFRAAFDDVEVHLGGPYDHYGSRGVADVYVRVRTPEPMNYLIGLKADAAVRHATGANEILRQYRRMERYFYKDDEHAIRTKLGHEGPGVHALLLFVPTKRCVEHVRERTTLCKLVDPDATVEGVEAARKVAFLTSLDRTPKGELDFLSLNGPFAFSSVAFREAVPLGSRLAGAFWDDDWRTRSYTPRS